jgi:hypothetical protein
MYGERLDRLVAIQCCVCLRWVAVRLDQDDLDRHVRGGGYVQHVFCDRSCKPYLSPAERELFISAVCGDCWALLCPSSPLAYN